MKRLFWVALAVVLAFAAGFANANPPNQANQTVIMEIKEVNALSVSGDPAPLVLEAATAGSPPDPVEDDQTYYAVSTNQTNRKIIGRINSNMPSNTWLQVKLAPPYGATSTGFQILTTTSQDLVLGISRLRSEGNTITYQFLAEIEAEPQNIQRTVTFILTGN